MSRYIVACYIAVFYIAVRYIVTRVYRTPIYLSRGFCDYLKNFFCAHKAPLQGELLAAAADGGRREFGISAAVEKRKLECFPGIARRTYRRRLRRWRRSKEMREKRRTFLLLAQKKGTKEKGP